MSKGRFERVRELFLELCDLDQDAALRILDAKCADDPEIRTEVLSLLDFDVPHDVVLESVTTETQSPKHGSVVPGGRPSRTGAIVSQIVGGQTRQRAWALLVLVGLIGLGLFLHTGVRRTLRVHELNDLEALNRTAVAGLDAWIKKRTEMAESLANDPPVREAVIELCRIAAGGHGSEEELAASLRASAGSLAKLEAALAVYNSYEGSIGVAVHDLRGISVYWGGRSEVRAEFLGRPWKPKAARFGQRLLETGKPVFIRPTSPAFWGVTEVADNRAVSWMCTPVYDKALGAVDRKIVAVMTFGKYAHSLFSTILKNAQSGNTGETYAFDREGRMVSESRFKDQLEGLGIIQAGEQIYTSLNVHLRPPGDGPIRARPFTMAVAEAMDKVVEKRAYGTVKKPYVDYRGVKVLGVWCWDEDWEMGLITEVDMAEAYNALFLLDYVLSALFVLIVVLAVMSLFFSISIFRLRRRVGEQQRLGQYTLIRKIGEGGMGVVYLAQHALLKRPTAVKILVDDSDQQAAIARFEREVQLASQLTHPNTIEIFDFGRTQDGTFFYAMEYLDGVTLAELIASERRVGAGRVIHILKQICSSLAEAHGRGLIHRDIKPQNIMLCERGGVQDVVKVLDFGLVIELDSANKTAITERTQVTGTLLYMAPERLRDPHAVDARVDIYSLGAVAYNLLTGRSLFKAKTDVDVLYKVINEQPLPIRECVDDELPDPLVDLVEKCLAKDPADRPQRVRDILDCLDSIEHEGWTAKDAKEWWQERSYLF